MSPLSGPGRAERTSLRIASTTNSPTGRRRTSRCAAISSSAVMVGFGLLSSTPVVSNTIFRSFVEVGIVDVDLHQEAVELRFRQRIGAFLLDRVLRREHVEGARHVVAVAGDGDVLLLHRLQQRRLGARARRG